MKVGFFYDYDLTLTEEFQQMPVFRKYLKQLKRKYHIKAPEDYWSLCSGKDKEVTWMKQFLKDAKTTFHHLTNKQLQDEFADQVKIAEGLPLWFKRINDYSHSLGMEPEHHVITVGLSHLVAGNRISPYLKSITGGEFLDNGKGIYKISSIIGPFKKVENLKRICKGGDLYKDLSRDDYSINYNHVLVFGDGDTDKDLFRYIKQRGGTTIAVFEKENKKAFDKSVATLGSANFSESSVNVIVPRDYSPNSKIEKKVFQTLENIAEAEKNCDMDWELVNKWLLNQIKNKDIVSTIKRHFGSCEYCRKKSQLDFIFD